MKKIVFFVLISVLACFAHAGQPPSAAAAYRIGMVLYRGVTDAETGFMNYLKSRLPRVEFIIRDCAEDAGKLPGIVAEMKRLKPDLVYTFGTSATIATVGTVHAVDPALHLIDIPVVFNIVADPVGAGIATQLASSGRNLTGVMHLVPMESQLRALQSAGTFRKMAVLYSRNEKNSVLTVQALKNLAAPAGIDIDEFPIEAGDANDEGLAGIMRKILLSKPEIVYIPSDSFLIKKSPIVSSALRSGKIPSFSATEGPIQQNGILMGLVSTYYNAGAFAGYRAEQILANKIRPENIPMSTLNQFSFLINMKSALEIGYYPPLNVLRFARVVDAAR